VHIGLLGPFEVRLDDGAVTEVPGARLRGLLAALALEPGHVVPNATLVDWIWGERPPAEAANALQRLVSRLRKVLPEGLVEGQPGGYRLTVEPGAVDAVRFERLLGQARGDEGLLRVRLLREALALWRGPAMQDVGLAESSAFDAAVTRLDGLHLTAMEDRFDAEIGLGHGAVLVTELADAVAAHPLRERLVAALMRALAAAGRDSEALLVYQRTREALADELGADPSPALSAVHVALLRGELGRREDNSRKSNLRAELTSFVGKDADVAAVRDLIARHRLTTLTGPGGSGKTRLATETARTLLGDLPDGAWLVELAAIGADGDKGGGPRLDGQGSGNNAGGGPEGLGGGRSIAQAALTALGLRDTMLGGSPDAELTGRLITAIREREALLILDNCEHVIEQAAAFAHRVLGECQRLRILATSREPLGITGEELWPVVPLAVPDGDAGPGEIESSPAVRLLRDRAGAVRRDLAAPYQPDGGTLATMARVCRALDGMPLAIELAAARLRTMSLEQLASRLDDRFRLLTSGSRTALPRHRTLRAMVDWSWELLAGAERMVLRRLSVFSGGASLEAAERICADGAFELGAFEPGAFEPEQVEPEQVLELLTALAEKSLLVAAGGSVPRYRMTGTIREYAGQRLAEAGEADLARHAHLRYFTELTETADPHLRRAEQLDWLARLEAEHDNIGAAMRGALAAGEAQAAMRLAGGAGWYWWLGGHKAEGLELLTAAASTPGEVPDEIRALACAMVVHFVSDGRTSEHQLAEWVHRAYRYSQRSQSRNPLLALVVPLERMLQAPDAFLPAWELVLENEDPWVRALARLQLGKMRIVSGQDTANADAYFERALAEFEAIGERFGIWFALTELADRAATRGELTVACEYYERAIAAVTEVGSADDVIRMRSRQAQLYWLLGDADASAAAIAEAQRYADGVTWPDALAELALARAELARWAGDAEEARRQLGVAAAVLGDAAEQASFRAVANDLLGYLADDLAQARAYRAAACRAATDAVAEAGYVPLIAKVIIGVADLALRRGQDEQAARLLAASASVRGLPDRSQPDIPRIEREARRHLGDARFAEVTREGARAAWRELAEATLAG
jgi:predicted ATPase/DNA-binding SARP family transcriptional activator